MANSTSTDNLLQILTLVKLLSEETLYCYSLGANGGFVRSAIRYFERSVDRGQVITSNEATDPDNVLDYSPRSISPKKSSFTSFRNRGTTICFSCTLRYFRT